MMEPDRTLAIAKLVIDGSVPLSIAIIGWMLHGRLQSIEARVSSVLEVQKLRVACFSEISPMLNDLFCFGTYVGHWAAIDPGEILAIKRRADALFFRNFYLWTEAMVAAYREFMEVSFESYQGKNSTAKSKANVERHKEVRAGGWRPEWDGLFIPSESRSRRFEVQRAYARLNRAMAASVGHEVSEVVANSMIVTATG